jgi:hypothetical protein
MLSGDVYILYDLVGNGISQEALIETYNGSVP